VAVTLADAVVYLVADNTQLKKDLAAARGETQTWTGAVSTMAGNLLSHGITGAINIALSAARELAGALQAAVVDSVKLAGSFESQVAELGIAAKESGLSTEQLHDAALAVGGDTRLLGVSATGAADAMTGLFKAGLTAGEIFGDLDGYMAGTSELGGALRASIDLAAASQLDMVEASDLAAITLATFGGELGTTEERAAFVNAAMDNFVKAADASVSEVPGLADALTNVGSTAAMLGIPLEDVVNALALLSTRGIQGAEAGTALKSMLTNMQRPTEDTTAAWNDIGVSMYDAEGNMRALPAIMTDVEGGLSGMTEEQRNLWVQQVAGTYGMKAMATLLAEGKVGWEDMAAATEAATGINEQAAIKANTTAGRMEALAGNVETLKIEVGEKLLPYLIDFVNWLIPMIDQYGPTILRIFDNWIESAEGLAAAFSPLAEPIQLLMEAFTELMAALGIETEGGAGWFGEFLKGFVMDQVLKWVENLTRMIESLTAAMDVARGVIEWFKGAWDTLTNIQLPDWMKPGSPTPFEMGLRGITDAMTDLARLGVPTLETALAGMGQGNQDNRRNFTNYGGIQMFPQGGAGNPLEELWEMGT
jgi:TP901 family phage tail tape measure protein